MITKNIWMATWNCENQAPDTNTLDNHFIMSEPGWGTAASPDIIVVALQEAVRQPANTGDYVSTRLAKVKATRLGHAGTNAGNPNLDYQEVERQNKYGMTKGTINAIQMGALVRADTAANVTQHAHMDYTQGAEGKGGVCIHLEITQGPDVLRLGFIGAHLDSSNAANADNQILRLLLAITGIGATGVVNTDRGNAAIALNAQYDAVFFMGDLNYRLAPNAAVPQATTAAQMANKINNPIQRAGLWALDTLPNSPLVQVFGFNFPQPAPLFMPSYKLDYETAAANNPCLRMYQPGTMVQVETAISDCYFGGNDANVYNANRQAFDVGWLDRIGWLRNAVTMPDPLPGPAGGSPVTVAQYRSYTDFILSDHAPVLMKAVVTKP